LLLNITAPKPKPDEPKPALMRSKTTVDDECALHRAEELRNESGFPTPAEPRIVNKWHDCSLLTCSNASLRSLLPIELVDLVP